MSGNYLQLMVESLPERCLPLNWSGFDLSPYSPGKRLWDYQQDAIRNSILALWKYYQSREFTNNEERKSAFMKWYCDFGMEINIRCSIDRSSYAKRKLVTLLESYYTTENNSFPYEQFINRMSFWMATGSGKTIVIVKLISVLNDLMRRGEIPEHDILVLTHRDDLLEQLRSHVEEFNSNGSLFSDA